jgi:hypothetical protein
MHLLTWVAFGLIGYVPNTYKYTYFNEAESGVVLAQVLVLLRVEGGGGNGEHARLLREFLRELVVSVLVWLTG